MTAIVLGLDFNGLGVVRALGRAGIRVVGIDHNIAHAGRASRYCGRTLNADVGSATSLLGALEELDGRLDGPAALFPTMDDTVRILSRERDRIPRSYRWALPGPAMTSQLMEKGDLAGLAKEHGWPAPFTAVCHNEPEVAALAGSFPYPGVMKPARRDLDATRGIPRLWTFGSREELLASYRELARWGGQVVLQEVIPGPDSSVVFCLFYADRTSTPLALFTGRKIRQYPPLYGSTSSAEPTADDAIRAFAGRFIEDVGYRGLGSVEMKIHGRTGELCLVEPTVGRTDYQSYLAVANGVNIPETAYRDLMGLPPRAPAPAAAQRTKYVVAVRDFRSAVRQIRDGRWTWRGYLRSLRGPKKFVLLQAEDPRPFLYRVHYLTLGRIGRLARRALLRVAGATRSLFA